MALWVEIRCDDQTRGAGCVSERSNGPMTLTVHGRTGLTMAVTGLEKQALADGWKRTRGTGQVGFICPACAAWREKQRTA